MKKLKIAASLSLALMALGANAEVGTMFTQLNDAGGTMNFTDGTSKKCDERRRATSFNWQYVDTVHADGRVLTKGCWRYDFSTKNFVVIWGDGAEYRYPVANFSTTSYFDEKYSADKVQPKATKRNQGASL